MPRKDAQPGAKEVAAVRRTQALAYRIAGNSYRAIGKQLNVSHQQAFNDVTHELAAIATTNTASAETLRTLELERLDVALAGIMGPVQKGHLGAIDRLIRIGERRAKLLGLDAPDRQEHTGKDGTPLIPPPDPAHAAWLAARSPAARSAALAAYESALAALGVPPPDA